MSAWQSNFVTANGVRQHYTRTGGDKPTLVLAHGFSDDGLCWTSAAERLAQTYDVIMVDARGHGQSALPTEDQTYAPLEQADDLAGLIAALHLERPLLLGHSMGAIAILALAGRHPDLPRAIALEDPPPWWTNTTEHTPFDEKRKAEVKAWLTSLKGRPREALIAAQRLETPNWPEVDLAPWVDSKLRFDLRFLDQIRPTFIQWPTLLQGILCPVLLITAELQRGALVTPEAATALQAWLPQLRTAHIAEAGHSIRRDQRERFLEAVNTFFTEQAPAS